MIGTYEIVNIINGKRYVGSSTNINKRFIGHRCHLRKNKHHCAPLQHSYNKHGKDAFIYNVLEICEESELEAKENELLKSDNLYNVFKDAYSLRKENHPMYQQTHTDEAKKKIKDARSKQVISHSKETRDKIGAAHKGRKSNPQHIAKMVAARNGKAWNSGKKTGQVPGNKIHFTDLQKEDIISKYNSGTSIEQLRLSYKCSWDTIKDLLTSNNIQTRNISQQKQIQHVRKAK